jgi:ribosome maturation protein SDO1
MFYKGEKNTGNLENTVVARIKRGEHNFEILVYPFLAWDYKHNLRDVKIEDVIAFEEIYSDLQKSNVAPKESLIEAFQTEDIYKIADKIIKDGDVQLTTVQRQMLLEKREKEIISYITKNAHDPKNKTPIPEQRILNAFEELKIKINLNKKKEKEIEEIIDKLKRIMPISFEKIIVTVEIPSTYAGKASAVVYKYDIAEQKWLSNGSLVAKIRIPAGLKQDLVSNLNTITHGNIVIRVENEE